MSGLSMKFKFALGLAAFYGLFVALIAVLAGVLWSDLTQAERAMAIQLLSERAPVVLLIAVLAFFPVAFLVSAFFKAYVQKSKWMADEAQIILSANPAHRISNSSPVELQQLGATINALAERYEAAQRDEQAKIAQARADMEEEKNRLAALMSELSLSVLVCNVEGLIILYNHRAKQLLAPGAEQQAGLIGLGRSVFGILDRNLFVHALDEIRHRLGEGAAQPVSNLITTTPQGHLIRLQVTPVLARQQEITGFILTLEDISRSVETSSKRDLLLRALSEGTRASLANIRAAVENMLAYPDMEATHRDQFTRIIGDEAGKLSGHLNKTLSDYSEYIKTQWPIESMRGSDLISAIARRIETHLGITAQPEAVDAGLWLKVESFSMAQAMTYLASRLKTEFGVRSLGLALAKSGRLAHLDLLWSSAPLGTETVIAWENEPLNMGGEASPVSLKEILEHHDATIWYQHDRASHRSGFRLALPLTQPVAGGYGRIELENRPEYYDFDLFNQPGQTKALDERLLTELSYTVFDTETTGLEPSNGDEIISIGAVRIVNGRLLQHEVFEQLIDPRHSVSRKSIAIHGITPEMLRGQPTISEVLPSFCRFCEDTVLVAHNAAFDMRFLQMKESQTGIRFTQPVLDTLMLSPVVYPQEQGQDHKLEAIAERLGVNVVGRHTALGDAMVTGEIFLRMIPMLAEKGIRTLKQAREASQKTYYARVNY
jgi:DNA polymerase-3 subunit epsilon